jgi:hypothetical protein
MQSFYDDTQRRTREEFYRSYILQSFTAVSEINFSMDETSFTDSNMSKISEQYFWHSIDIVDKLQRNNLKVFELMQIKLDAAYVDVNTKTPRYAFAKGSGFLKSFSNSSILEIDPNLIAPDHADQLFGYQMVCYTVIDKVMRIYDGFNRDSNGDIIQKATTKVGKILQRLIATQHKKPGFILLLQSAFDIFASDKIVDINDIKNMLETLQERRADPNRIEIEKILKEFNIKPNQIVDMYIQDDKLFLQTNDRREIAIDKSGSSTEYSIRRSIFGTMHRIPQDDSKCIPYASILDHSKCITRASIDDSMMSKMTAAQSKKPSLQNGSFEELDESDGGLLLKSMSNDEL